MVNVFPSVFLHAKNCQGVCPAVSTLYTFEYTDSIAGNNRRGEASNSGQAFLLPDTHLHILHVNRESMHFAFKPF